jgi:UDP-N-acetylglucosamine:LPS N-acetylglucosamine transferase
MSCCMLCLSHSDDPDATDMAAWLLAAQAVVGRAGGRVAQKVV